MAEAQKRGLKVPDKIMDFLWDCKYCLVKKGEDSLDRKRRKKERQTDRQTDRQADKDTEIRNRLVGLL